MKNLPFVKLLSNISLTKKLYFIVVIMTVLIVSELCTLSYMIRTLSSSRALVDAEGLWAKAQKDAVYSLVKYGYTHDEKDYQQYLTILRVPLGDKIARLELMKPHPNLGIVRKGFIEGRINPEDINGAIKLLTQFPTISYINNAIMIWTEEDNVLDSIQYLGNQQHAQITNKKIPVEIINQIQNHIHRLNDGLTLLEDSFSYTIGEGSRLIARLVLITLFSIVITVEIICLLLILLVRRAMSKGFNEIVRVARKIAKADFSDRVKVLANDEIGHLAGSFNIMIDDLQSKIKEEKQKEEQLHKEKERAESAEIEKRVGAQFLANMSHEIRTPMNGIVGFTDIMLHTSLSQEQKQYLEIIKASGDNLLVIINDILDFSRIKSGKMPIEQREFKLSQSISMCTELMRPKALKKGINLFSSIDPKIPNDLIGDPTRLNQILINLTANAIKFTSKGEVSINVKMISEQKNEYEVEFAVKDTGIGIPNEKLALIFDAFTQAELDTSRKYGGTGLGLAIVKQLAELQGGSISVTSEEGRGSCFYFKVKYKKGNAQSIFNKTDNITYQEKKIKNLNVLLVEDNDMNQLLAKKIFSDWGWNINVAGNGIEAIESIKKKDFDIILMDLQMPEMDGYEATSKIRGTLPPPKCNVPILAMTANVMSSEEEKCYKAGMNGYISKPFEAEVLYSRIVSITGDFKLP